MSKLLTVISAAAALLLPSARASFHFFDIQECYTNSDGSVQFVELFTTSGSQNSLSGQTLQLKINNVTSNSFPFGTNLSGDTTNKTVLVGTANLGPLYGVTPDYVLPANFLSAGAGRTIDFASGTDVVSLANLPVDGVMSLNGVTTDPTPSSTSVNSQATPKNFAGATATIPEPSAFLALAAGTLLLTHVRRR